jgi:PAS domain S-box-containing protein
MHEGDRQPERGAAREGTDGGQSAGEARYRYAFEAAGVSLWEEDFTEVAAFLERLRTQGVRDFRAHFDCHPDMVAAAVPLVKVRDVNRETLRLFGASSKEELKGSLARVFTENSLCVFKEELIALAEGRGSLAADVELRTLTGELRQFMFTVTFPGRGEPLERVLVTLVDVTERKRAEQRQHEKELRMRLALEATGAATWIIDYTREAMESFDEHACEMAGLDASRTWWPAGTFCELLHPDDRPMMQAALAATYAAAGSEMVKHGPLMEYRILRSDGQVRWLQGAGVVQRDVGGRAVQFVGVSIDITDRHRAQQALLEADRRKDEFLAVLAHELRNPLAPIRNGVQILRLRTAADALLQRTLNMMDRQASHLVRLVDDLLDISRITRGKLDLRQRRLLLTEVLASAVDSSRTFIEARGHELTVEIRPGADALQVDGDADRLVQVFSNLLSNSAKYTDKGGRITLTLDCDEREAVVRVQDNGIGIPPQALERVFEMFSQAHAREERADGGLGIGLSLVRTLVQMHNGSVTACSDGLGTGSTFTVRLPLAQPHGATPSIPPDATAAHRPTEQSGMRVLVVDDSADAAASLMTLLELAGHEVRTAGDGVEAIEQTREFCPDVIFMDLGMPRIDGVEATRRIRALPQGRKVRIIALTGWGQDADRQRTRSAGMDDHIVKPVSPEALQRILCEPVDVSGRSAPL